MHGGTVRAESDGAGRGSRFTIRLPLSEMEVRAPVPFELASGALAGSSRRILVVEDSADSAEAMMLLLRELGHVVAVVRDGAAAMSAAQSFHPEVILLDIGLPGVDGYELARRFRQMPETSRARVIAVTGYGQPDDRARTAAAGFHMHLVKPVDPAKLSEAIA
jgi:CheY-like chemotaxis protein